MGPITVETHLDSIIPMPIQNLVKLGKGNSIWIKKIKTQGIVLREKQSMILVSHTCPIRFKRWSTS